MSIPKQKILFLTLTLSFLFAPLSPYAYSMEFDKAINGMDINTLKTVDQVKTAVEKLETTLESANHQNQLSFELQKKILLKAGECISKLASFTNGKNLNKEKIKVYSTIRNTLKRNLAINEKKILFIQENKLDKLKDPAEFFKSNEWQNPQYLISIASYWMGWNGYYGCLQLPENDALRKELLEEAIKGFSRAFIDFEEEDVIVRSLLGRALCHGQLKAYESAKKDFSTVKRRLGKDHPLYIRCLYEENRILYATGNLELALRGIDEIREDYDKKIPPELAVGIDQLKAKILAGFLVKPNQEDRPSERTVDPSKDRIFRGLKQLAEQPNGMNEFYRYVRENSDRMGHLSYSALGPVGAMGVGDVFFEKKDFNRALDYYLPLSAESPKILFEKMDLIRLRIAYIFSRKEKWKDAVSVLKDFHKKFPDSYLLEQAIPLYYTAATNHYRQNSGKEAYKQFIDSALVYVTRCRGKCPDLSEAHFQLGQYYEKTGKPREAVKEFLRVDKDSPNLPIAQYYLLKNFVERLEQMKKTGQIPSREGDQIFSDGLGVAKSYKGIFSGGKLTGSMKRIHPQMVILQAELLTFDPNDRCEEILAGLKDFESQFPKERPLFAKAFQMRASCYIHLGKIDHLNSEMVHFTASGPLDKNRYDALRDLANTFYYQAEETRKKHPIDTSEKNAQAALMLYQHLYQLSCDHSDYKNNCDAIQLRMARVYIENDKLDQAEVLYQDILKRNLLSADALYGLGLLYEKKEQWEEALATWRRFSDGVKEGTYHWYESRYKTALAHMKLGHEKKACDILNITMVLHPDFGNDELYRKYQELKSTICKETK